MRIDIERIQQLQAELDQINSLDFKDIEFFENDKKVEIPQKVIDEFKLYGLNNVHFVTTEFYRSGGGEGNLIAKDNLMAANDAM